MSDRSPNLDLPYLMPSQAQKHVTHNSALQQLDALVQLRVVAIGADTPPAAPQDGEAHALGNTPTGDWAGHAGQLAIRQNGAWTFLPPRIGWRAWDSATGTLRVWDGAAWALPPAAQDNLDGIGIGTSADAHNRLSVRGAATLLSHDGDGHQLKINKSSDTDTASLLYQSGWTGHAEAGLAGETAYSVKVSGDGSNWVTALRFDPVTGLASGAAVQSETGDTTAGRLMTVGAFGLGVTSAPTLMSDLDATDLASGLYKMTAATAHRPAGPDRGVVEIRRAGTGAFAQTVIFETGASVQRYYANSAFTPWQAQYGADNVVGAVSENGGVPTGAVIESGSTGNGDYVRFADGTQICTNANAPITTAPKPFAGPVTKIDGDKLWIGRWF